MVAITNIGSEVQMLEKGERIMQGIFVNFLTCGDSPSSDRKGGIGSSGRF